MPSRLLTNGRAEGARKSSAPRHQREIKALKKRKLQRKERPWRRWRLAGACEKKWEAVLASRDAERADQHRAPAERQIELIGEARMRWRQTGKRLR